MIVLTRIALVRTIYVINWMLVWLCVEVACFAFEIWLALLRKRVNAFNIIGALIHSGSIGIDAFESFAWDYR